MLLYDEDGKGRKPSVVVQYGYFEFYEMPPLSHRGKNWTRKNTIRVGSSRTSAFFERQITHGDPHNFFSSPSFLVFHSRFLHGNPHHATNNTLIR